MNKLLHLTSCILLFVSACVSCGDSGEDRDNSSQGSGDFNVSGIVLPSTIESVKGGECTLKTVGANIPRIGDVVVLTSLTSSFDCEISKIGSGMFSFVLNEQVNTDRYSFAIRRAGQKKTIGDVNISIIYDVDIDIEDGTTVYGAVLCQGEGVKDVVVTDGIEVVSTDENGIYQLMSKKTYGCVSISIPGGYEVITSGVLPKFYDNLTETASIPERHDFQLVKVPNDNYKLIVLGDMHLANRNNDIKQFRQFTLELNQYIIDNPGTKFYAITLGDMTWDLYWYSKSYWLPNYIQEINALDGIQVFHTMGNHDNDMHSKGDLATALKYSEQLGPTYYSFNLGNVHYIVLDNIICTNPGGESSEVRTYDVNLTSDEISWLKKDLAFVPKTMPVVLTGHAPYYKPGGTYRMSSTAHLESALSGYKAELITGHTHVVYNVDAGDIREHNSGAICASWWWCGKLTPGLNLSIDGSPAGYGIWDVNGTDIKWRYKGTGWPDDYQFRSYDLNNVAFTWDDVPNMPESIRNSSMMKKYIEAYPANSNNQVLINIWNWNDDWSLEVTENGKPLTYSKVTAYDPLHIAALSVKRFNDSSISSDPNFLTETTTHCFKVTASSATSTLDIKVVDDFGNVYREIMTRPKAFSTDAYLYKP